MIRKPNEIQLSNLYLVTSMLLLGHKLMKTPEKIISKKGETVLFTFEKNEQLLNDINSYKTQDEQNLDLAALFGIFEVVYKDILNGIKTKCDNYALIEKDDKIAIISDKLDQDKRRQLLKRLV